MFALNSQIVQSRGIGVKPVKMVSVVDNVVASTSMIEKTNSI